MVETDWQTLIGRYMQVCNTALEKNKERFPFKQILGAARRAEQGRKIELLIDGDRQHSFVIEIKGERIMVEPHGDCPNCNCDRRWNVSSAYLNDVVTEPEAYISNPARLNWEWMYDVSTQPRGGDRA